MPMPIQLSKKKAEPASDGLDAMLECHERIRRFLDLAMTLATTEDAPAEQIASAAADLERYFTMALPLHAEDEELLLRPLLAGAALAPNAAAALAALEPEHHTIHGLLDALVPRWREIARAPSALSTLRSELVLPTRQLKEIFAEHLEKEERDLFPAARAVLTEEQRVSLLREIQQRRRPA